MIEAVVYLALAITSFTFAYRGRGFYVPISTIFGPRQSRPFPMSNRLRLGYALLGALQLAIALLAFIRAW